MVVGVAGVVAVALLPAVPADAAPVAYGAAADRVVTGARHGWYGSGREWVRSVSHTGSTVTLPRQSVRMRVGYGGGSAGLASGRMCRVLLESRGGSAVGAGVMPRRKPYLFGFTWSYDAGGAITTQVVVGALATTDRYAYNPSGTLKSFAQGSGEDAVTLSYGWDHDGNRVSAGVSGSVSHWSYRADDSLAVGDPAAGASVSYHYSAAGELTRTDASGGDDVCSTTSYDAFLRTREQTQSPTGACPDSVSKDTTRYSYDGLDRVQTTTTTPAAGDPVVSRSSYDGLGSTLVGQTHGLTGGVVSPGATPNVVYQLNVDGAVTGYAQDAAGSTPASTTWLDTDGHGNTTGLLPDAVGVSEVSCAVNYDPFGTPGAAPGSTAKLDDREVCATGSAQDTTANAIWYRGQVRNATYGTYQLGARTYDPSLAAFTTPDTHRVDTPAQDLSVGTDPLTANTYTYVNGDPVNLADPNGHRAVDTSGNEVPWCVTHQCTPAATQAAHTDYHHIAAQTHAEEQVEHTHLLLPWTDPIGMAIRQAQQAQQAQQQSSAWMRFAGGFFGEAKDTALFLLDSFHKLETNYYLTPAGIHESYVRDLAIARAIAHPKDTLHSIVAACTADVANCAGRGTFIALTSMIGGAGAEVRLARGTEELSTLAANTAARARAFQYGDLPEGVLGSTDELGNITIQRGLSGREFEETLRHETVHSVLTPPAPLNRITVGLYNKSGLYRYAEEALAEGYATRSIGTGLAFPFAQGYVSGGRLAFEAGLLGSGAAAAGYAWSR